MVSKVFLVGAGPGDSRLITVRGLDCLRRADVVVYDRLVDEALLAEAPAAAQLIYVGKAASHHAMRQEEINAVLVEQARRGKTVVRLKGGDPFVFGRGGEEALALAEAGVPFEVVPGVTSAVAVPAYAGIPVTHRRTSASFTVITGHEDPAKGPSQVDWARLPAGTLVFLMGAENLATIVARLLEHGRPPDTPAAFIHRGTTPQQRTVAGTLADIAERVRDSGLAAPAVLVVGEVVKLRDRLVWWEKRPLFGRRVLVTRSREQASALTALLVEEGAQPIELPTIVLRPMEDNAGLDAAISGLGGYDWVVFTSANGVRFFWERLLALGRDARALPKVCAIGPATAEALAARGLRADFVPQEYVAEAVAAGLGKLGVAGQRVLLPRAAEAREVLPEELARLGATVDEVPVYRTLLPEESRAQAQQLLGNGQVDVATFTSSSTLRNLLALLDERAGMLDGVAVACIGPVTAATARELGLRVDVVAREYTIPGLVAALRELYQR